MDSEPFEDFLPLRPTSGENSTNHPYVEYENFFKQARDELNYYLSPYPKKLRRYLVKTVIAFRDEIETDEFQSTLIKNTNQNMETPNSMTRENSDALHQKMERVSTRLTQLFGEIKSYLDLINQNSEHYPCPYSDFVGSVGLEIPETNRNNPGNSSRDSIAETESSKLDQDYLFRLLANYIATYFYMPFAQLTNNEVKDFNIDQM